MILSITFRTPGQPQAELFATARSGQLRTVPLKVTSSPSTATKMVFETVAEARLRAASMSDLTTVADSEGLMEISLLIPVTPGRKCAGPTQETFCRAGYVGIGSLA